MRLIEEIYSCMCNVVSISKSKLSIMQRALHRTGSTNVILLFFYLNIFHCSKGEIV